MEQEPNQRSLLWIIRLTYGIRIQYRLADVISIVRPETLLAWNRRMKRRKRNYSRGRNRTGRPPKEDATETLVVKLTEGNHWGYVRIVGELAKLGHLASPSYVRDVLKKHGISPSHNGTECRGSRSSSPPGRHVGGGLLYRGGLDASRPHDLLRAVLCALEDPPSSHCRLHTEPRC